MPTTPGFLGVYVLLGAIALGRDAKARCSSKGEVSRGGSPGSGGSRRSMAPRCMSEKSGSITPYLTPTLFPTWKRGGPDLLLVWLMVHSSVELSARSPGMRG